MLGCLPVAAAQQRGEALEEQRGRLQSRHLCVAVAASECATIPPQPGRMQAQQLNSSADLPRPYKALHGRPVLGVRLGQCRLL